MPTLHTLSPLAQALKLRRLFQPKLLGSTLGLVLSLPMASQVMAQDIDFNIETQPLSSALQEFGRQANLQVLYSPEDVTHLNSNRLMGRYSPSAAIAQLLKNTGISFNIQGDTLIISARSDNKALNLGATSITGQALGSLTDGSGSYTTGSSNTATKLNMSLRETPSRSALSRGNAWMTKG